VLEDRADDSGNLANDIGVHRVGAVLARESEITDGQPEGILEIRLD
jgi:hypothetical protein